MDLRPGLGIGKVLFGMKSTDIVGILGIPSLKITSDDGNQVLAYNDLMLRLEFYSDEDNRLALISCNSGLMTFDGKTIIGESLDFVKILLDKKGLYKWEAEKDDIFSRHFCEEVWTTIEVEFGKISKIEIGALIKGNDEFDWKFKS